MRGPESPLLVHGDDEAAPELVTRPKKRVHWGHVEVREFRVSYSSCVVPSSGGPPVGLIGKPIAMSVRSLQATPAELDEEDARPRGDINDVWLCSVDRVQILQLESGFCLEDIGLLCREIEAVQEARLYSRLDFDASFALGAGNLAQLEALQELRNTVTQPQPRPKVMLFETELPGIIA